MLTQDEAELYDRQIRLWGVNAQARLRQSKVLMLGFNGVASEVAKILTLAGIDTLKIVDNQPLQESDLTSNLFCRPQFEKDSEKPKYRTHAVKSKLMKLNPLVKVVIDNRDISSLQPEDYKGHDLVTLHSMLTINETSVINDICIANQIKFYIVLDYGFYGFIFNYLGKDFKFTYEQYVDLKSDKNDKNSGSQKEPISLVEVPMEEPDDDDVAYGTSDDENDRGNPRKKKLRVHSPNRVEHIAKVDNEMETKVAHLSYVPFKNMISLEHTTIDKKTSPILLLSVGLFKFYSEHGHLPSCQDEKDSEKLMELLNSLVDSSSIKEKDNPVKRLDSEWLTNIQGSLSPVCAILGGVAGQDMIRALSGKDIPIYNTFAFDGINMDGIVNKVGIKDVDATKNAPIVRDVLQIDDDDDDDYGE